MHFELRMALLLFVMPQCVLTSAQCPNLKTDLKLIRKRRHVAWPEGSNYVLTADFAKAFLTHVPSGWMITMDLDVSFPLPDEKFISAHLRKKLHHRQKREFWDRLKDALDLHNFDGHSCILRSICEAKFYLAPPGMSIVHDVLGAMFTAPVDDPEFTEEIRHIYDDITDPNFCERNIECPFSIINFILSFNNKRN